MPRTPTAHAAGVRSVTGTASQGLTSDEARRRLGRQGPNAVPRPARVSVLRRVGRQLRDPMLLLLMAAGLVTAATGDTADTVIIGAVVALNTSLGVVQEWRAARAVDALDDLRAPWASVVRDGRPLRIRAADVVIGDLLLLGAGDVVPADARVEEGHLLQLDESAITGESAPRAREAGEEVEAGTVVTRGRGTARVLRTGGASGLGRIAELVRTAPVRSTPLQERLTRLSGQLVVAVSVLAVVVGAVGLVQGRSLVDMTIVAISLAVAAVPESLPAVVAITLALGAHRMARSNAVVRTLPAVETLGSVTVLASDKTGTLTEGHMTAEHVLPAPLPEDGTFEHAATGGDDARLLRDMVLCNDARAVAEPGEGGSFDGDALEVALLASAVEKGVSVDETRTAWPRVAEQPFDNRSRRMVTVHQHSDGRSLIVCKGAAEAVLPLVADRVEADRARDVADQLSAGGHRVLIVADRLTDHGTVPQVSAVPPELTLAGLLAFSDPPRESSRGVIRDLSGAGVRVVLVSGDHASTVQSVARRIGLPGADGTVVDGTRLGAFLGAHEPVDVAVFARIRPEEKVDIVDHFRARGEVVAMTGDGVNDAPALRHADIGVAMGSSGTEVARQAADVVLLDDELSTLVRAVEEGRRVYANIRMFLRYGISGGLAEVLTMLVGPFLGMGIPLLPGQILWINMLTHGLPGVAFSAEPAAPDLLRRPPTRPGSSIVDAPVVRQIAVVGTLVAVVALAAGGIAALADADVRTGVFAALAFGQLAVALGLRSRVRRRTLRQRGLELAVLGALLLQVLAVYFPPLNELLGTTPLPFQVLAAAFALGLVPGLAVRRLVRTS